MADTKISALGASAALTGAEALPAVQGGTTLRITPAQIAAFIGSGQHPALGAMLGALTSGQSQTWSIFSDSTGRYEPDGTKPRGVFRTAQQIAAAVGPGVRVEFHGWDDTSQKYLAPLVIAPGTNGERCIQFDGTSGSRTRLIDATTAQVPGASPDLEVALRFTPASTTPAANQTLFAHNSGTGARGFYVYMAATSGDLILKWFPVSTSETFLTFVVPAATAALSASAINHIKFTLDVDNGNGGYTATAWKSNDFGATWTTLTQQATSGGTTSVGQPAGVAWEIGGRGITTEPFAGRIYRVQVRDGIDGAPLLPVSVEAYTYLGASTVTDGGSPTLYVYNGAAVGKAMLYFMGQTGPAGTYAGSASAIDDGSNRFRKLLMPMSPGLVTLNDGHNEGSFTGMQFMTPLDAWLTAVKARNPMAAISYVVQNPEIIGTAVASQGSANAHIVRQRMGQGWAARNGLVLFDAMTAFYASPLGLPALMQADGVHPAEAAGYVVWASALCKAFGIAAPTG